MRLEQLTFTRFIAAFIVVVFHYGKEIFPFNTPYLQPFISSVVVSYFFVLSGFVLTISYYNRRNNLSTKQFFIKRIARFYPVYFLGIALMVYYSLLFYEPSSVSLFSLGINLLALQSWLPLQAQTINYPGWAMSVEVFLYLVFPYFITKIVAVWRQAYTISLVGIFWVLNQLIMWWIPKNFNVNNTGRTHDFFYYYPLNHLNTFLIGCAAALLFMYLKNSNYFKKRKNTDLLVVTAVFTLAVFLTSGISALAYHNGLLAPLYALIIISLSLNEKGFITKIFKNKDLIRLGSLSLSIYLLQAPVFNYAEKIKSLAWPSMHSGLFFYLTFAILLAVSFLITEYYEKPLQQKILNRYL